MNASKDMKAHIARFSWSMAAQHYHAPTEPPVYPQLTASVAFVLLDIAGRHVRLRPLCSLLAVQHPVKMELYVWIGREDLSVFVNQVTLGHSVR